MRTKKQEPQFAVCIKNEGYAASLEIRKIYQKLPDAEAEKQQMIRIIDESGEDYLYPIGYFAPINVPQIALDVFCQAA